MRVALGIAVLLAGCGGGDDGGASAVSGGSGTFALTRVALPVVEFELTNIAMSPYNSDAAGTFTLSATATAAEYDENQ